MDLHDSSELDLLLSDVKRLLDEDAPPSDPAQRADPVSQETRKFKPVQPQQPAPTPTRAPWEDPDFAGTYDGGSAPSPVVRSAGARRAPQAPAWQPPQQQPVWQDPARQQQVWQNPAQQPPVRQQPARPAQQPVWQEAARPAPPRQQPARQTPPPAQARRAERPAPTRAQRAAHQALAEDNVVDADDYDEPPKRPKRRFRWIGRLLVVLLLLLVLAAGGLYLLADQPTAGSAALGVRRSGVSTILLIGTDASDLRTDTLMLLSVDDNAHTANLVSIPRDTLVNGPYTVPKINGVYAVNGGGDEGMEMLLQRVTECIGFPPDGHVLVDLNAFIDLVDIMGGVTFDVPTDMRYSDPSQGLNIDLDAGEQKLDGVEAMGLVRFRSGYAAADLDRVNVQRAFVSAAAEQWVRPSLVFKLPRLLSWLGSNVETDLSLRNLTWLAKALMRADDIGTETLPGYATTIQGGSYYVLNPYDVAALVNRSLNPYVREITVDDLSIRN